MAGRFQMPEAAAEIVEYACGMIRVVFSRRCTVARRSSAAVPSVAAFALGAAVLFAAAPEAAQRTTQRGAEEPGGRARNPYAWPSLSELFVRAETIVAGEVLDMRSSWTADRREIFTTVTMRPDRRFKGGGRALIRFRIPGGTVGDTRLMVTHSPQLSVGERALVFLAGESGRLPRVVGGEAGKRHLRAGEDGSETILPGFAISGGRAGQARGLATLEELAAEIPRLAAAAGSH